MNTRLWLIGAPVALMILMAQAALWVPSYDRQASANPKRLRTFVDASIGDAKMLNPILSADTVSSTISGLMFEGLLEYDDELQLAGKLAFDWHLSETLAVAALEYTRLRDGRYASVSALTESLRSFVDADPELKSRFIEVRTVPAETRTLQVDESGTVLELSENRTPSDEVDKDSIAVEVTIPPTVELELSGVAPEDAQRLEEWLGPDYRLQLAPGEHVRAPGRLDDAARDTLLEAEVPVLSHRPQIVFELRQGVQFHDGHELDADDVRFTYEAIMNPGNLSPRRSDFEPVRSVEVLDSYTVKVTYKRLFSPAVSVWTMPLLPEHLLNDERMAAEMQERGLSAAARERFGMRDTRFNRNPVGTGPFRFKHWASDELIELQAHEAHWQGRPEYDAYYMRILPDTLAQEVEFRAGAIDHYVAEPYQAERYSHDTNYRALSGVGLAYSYIGYNLRREPFSDPRVRRALGMALNVDELIEHVLYGQGERVTGPFAVVTPWYDSTVAALPYDTAGALELLKEAGWTHNSDGWLENNGKVLEFNLITNNGNEQRKTILAVAQNAWRRIGVKCNTQLFEWTVFLEDFVNPGAFDAVVLGWRVGPDPDLYQIFHSSQTGPRQLNFNGYTSDVVDDLIERIRVAYDPLRQQALTHRMHRQIAEDQPYTFLYTARGTRVFDRKIVELDPDGQPRAPRLDKAANPYAHINRWVKLEHTPSF
ncbi:MAG: ABC transporter substrate-binding protein [Gammaproteobacteria bacterium]